MWTSDLSVSEFALLDAAGYRPLEFVMGSSVYHIGWQQQNLRQSTELQVLSQAMYTARINAMGRMLAEAAQVGADGVVGTRLTFRQHGVSPEHIEFIAVGTSVISKDKPGRAAAGPTARRSAATSTSRTSTRCSRPATRPVEFVMGVCVWHVAAQGFMQTLRQIGQNIEMPQWTQGYYDARETALSRMQAEAERVQATGITGVEWAASEWMWGTHTLEFFTSGTAVRKVGEARRLRPRLRAPAAVTSSLPEGYVDPTDPAAVGAVLQATVDFGGLDAVTDLLARLPGTRLTPAVPKGFLRPAVPGGVWLGSESCWSCTYAADPPPGGGWRRAAPRGGRARRGRRRAEPPGDRPGTSYRRGRRRVRGAHRGPRRRRRTLTQRYPVSVSHLARRLTPRDFSLWNRASTP